MRSIIVVLLVMTNIFAAKMTHGIWESGQTFSDYLEARGIAYGVISNIPEDDRKYLSEIQSDAVYYELIDNNSTLIQSLIPINEEMQIHLYRDRKNGGYGFDIIPIEYEEDDYYAKVTIVSNPYSDTLETIHQHTVAKRLGQALKESIDTRRLQKGDSLAFTYRQKTRLGRLYHMPDIEVISLFTRGKENFIYVDEDGDGHKEGAKRSKFNPKGDFLHEVPLRDRSKRLRMPLRHIRITSKFTYRRWHPILKRYRPHHGTDFGAKRGTPLLAVYDGKVSYAGWMNGYGKVVKIRHPRGYESLYAHQSRIRVHRGEHVKKGQIIGYVGSTGRSTGPHLHFGLKKNGKWVDPMRHLQRASLSKSKYTMIVIKGAKENKTKLLKLEEENTPTYIWPQEESQRAIDG
jgi:murein DD-endopeptidase MepM/ murein hydrolase activator NlpD